MSDAYAELIKFHRNQLNLRQAELASLLQVTQATIARWEQGASVPDDSRELLDKLIAASSRSEIREWIQKILDVKSSYLLDSKEKLAAISIMLRLVKFESTGNESDQISKISIKDEVWCLVDDFVSHVRSGKNFDTDKYEIKGKRGEDMRLITRGYKAIPFDYKFDVDTGTVTIENVNKRTDIFSIKRISDILKALYNQFGLQEFPLANNVQLLGEGTEKPGLGKTIYDLNGRDIQNAQASSYLGPLLEHVGVLKWNEIRRGMKWKLIQDVPSIDILSQLLASRARSK